MAQRRGLGECDRMNWWANERRLSPSALPFYDAVWRCLMRPGLGPSTPFGVCRQEAGSHTLGAGWRMGRVILTTGRFEDLCDQRYCQASLGSNDVNGIAATPSGMAYTFTALAPHGHRQVCADGRSVGFAGKLHPPGRTRCEVGRGTLYPPLALRTQPAA